MKKNNKKFKIKEFAIDLYSSIVLFYYGSHDDYINYFFNKHNTEIVNHSYECLGSSVNTQTGRTVIAIFNEHQNLDYLTTLVHECVHASWLVAKHVGALFSEEVQEPQAYLVHHIFEEGLKFYKPIFERGKK